MEFPKFPREDRLAFVAGVVLAQGLEAAVFQFIEFEAGWLS